MGEPAVRRTVLALMSALLSLAPRSGAQTLVRNPQGDFILTYTDLLDTARTLFLEATDQVAASLTVELSASGGTIGYRYTLANGSAARRAVFAVDILCPAGDPTLTVGAPAAWYVLAEASGKLDQAPGLWLCSYMSRTGNAEVQPGSAQADLRIGSTWLPGPRAARAFGSVEPVVLPSEVEITPDTVLKLVERAQGFGFFTGGGLLLSVVAPARPPAALADPGPGLDSVAADRAQVCTLGWITDQGVCATLGNTLDQARQALSQGDNAGARTRLQDFLATLEAQHGAGLAVNDNAYWLLKVNAEFVLDHLPAGGTAQALFLAGSGGTANPPTLSLSAQAPAGTTAKYQDAPGIKYGGGNPWAEVGTWTGAPALVSGTLTALGETHVWLGLKNSDDQGTYFDVRAEVSKNGTLLASGETRCVQGITRNPANAREVSVALGPVTAANFNGTTDVLSLKLLTRIGTTETGARCGGHANAVGLRLYFDAASRAAQVAATF